MRCLQWLTNMLESTVIIRGCLHTGAYPDNGQGDCGESGQWLRQCR